MSDGRSLYPRELLADAESVVQEAIKRLKEGTIEPTPQAMADLTDEMMIAAGRTINPMTVELRLHGGELLLGIAQLRIYLGERGIEHSFLDPIRIVP